MTQTLIECLNRIKNSNADDTLRQSIQSVEYQSVTRKSASQAPRVAIEAKTKHVEEPQILKSGSPQKYGQILQDLLARHQKQSPRTMIGLTQTEKRMWQDIKNLHHLN